MEPDQTPPAPAGGAPRFVLAALLGSAALAVTLLADIRADEGRRTRAYRDLGGIVTICDGDTAGVRPGQVATDAECDARTARRLAEYARPVIACVPALREPGREPQLRASVRFAYNVGAAAFCRGSVGRRMRAGDWRGGCDAILLYDRARVNGRLRRVRGLTLRRQRERAVCLQGL
jgi:lysozyme